MIPSLEGLSTKAKEAPSPHEVRLAPLDTNPVFHSLGVIGIDLSRQTNTSITQQINFRGTLEKEKQQKTISKFSLESLNLTEKYKQ